MPSDRKITRHHLHVRDPARLSAFYGDLLGMRDFGVENGARIFGYDSGQCLLAFHTGATDTCGTHPGDFYWKTGITLHDLDAAVAYLREQGHSVRDPVQFRDIGYLTHVTDPDGLVIELLQQGFEGRERPVPEGHPVGAQATVAHITLRVTDATAAQAYFVETLGMRLMSIQPVDPHDFCLYFYGWSDENPPDPDLCAVGNREWLWSRPCAFIELQHLTKPDARISKSADPACAGFFGFTHSGGKEPVFVLSTTLEAALW